MIWKTNKKTQIPKRKRKKTLQVKTLQSNNKSFFKFLKFDFHVLHKSYNLQQIECQNVF